MNDLDVQICKYNTNRKAHFEMGTVLWMHPETGSVDTKESWDKERFAF